MKEIEIEGEKIYLKGKRNNWRVVKPIKIDGKINWLNLIAGGSWWKLGFIVFLVIIIIGAMNEYTNNLKIASACLRALPDYIDLSVYIKNPTLTAESLINLNNITLIS